ncbi:hypothetical protein [Leptothrix discophora]|uniref:Uncharacterized protein n=1 Tax=Leptothrix discophora TaxID=89 RepID=A0ABT9G3U5_LEPDI|nr:hypothetical protein [Leptothrix discophora]MDP4301076.1 hypothetical protein [Leptothrix discophora]
MSNCCGAKRAHLVAAGQPGMPNPAASSMPGRDTRDTRDTRLRLLRPLDLTLRGSATGRDYHFTPALPSVMVASADVDGLLSYGGLARVP